MRARDSCRDVAIFDMSLSDHGGILHLFDDRALILSSDFWKRRAEFQTLAGEPLLRYGFHGMLRPRAEVEIPGSGKELVGLPWLLMLGWFLIAGYL